MSHYTTEVRFLCESLSGLDESKGYNDIGEIIENARPHIFDFNYPIFDNNYKSVLETKILKHYYTREICEETYGLWKLRLNTRLNEIMPYYNKLYESELIEFNPLHDYDIQKTGSRSGESEVVNSGNDVVNSSTGGKDTTEREDGGKDTIEREDGGKDTRVNSLDGQDVLTEVNSGNDVQRIVNSGTDSVSGTGSGSSGKDTAYGGSDTTHTEDEPVLDKWDMYSDTPQGDIIGMNNDQNKYLTNARHITETGAGSSKDETRNYGQTIDEDGTYSEQNSETTTYGKTVADTTTFGKETESTTDYGKTETEETTFGKTQTEETTFGKTQTEETTYGKTGTETTTHGKKVNGTTTDDYLETITGKMSGSSYSDLLMKFRETFLNIDMLIIRDLADLFFNLW